MKLFATLFLVLTSVSFSQSTSLTGKIRNQKTGLSVPYVNIGVEGTYYGTSSNEQGEFKLTLKKGTHHLIISCVGYETKKIIVAVPNKKEINIEIKPIIIELPEVIVNAEENPAYAIIRKAIANKEKNKEGLLNYHYNFYSKNILKSGKDIVFIEEDIGEGFNDLSSNAVELKTEMLHTENISGKTFQQTDFNFFEKNIIDFTEDSLKLGKFVFHLPLSKFAFDYYDYKLLGLLQSGKHVFYQIEVIPLSKIRPTFKGEILIDDSSYALTGLDLMLINRNLMPFTNFKMSIIQNLINYKNYWLPKYYKIDITYDINYYYLIRLDSAITSYIKVFNNHLINVNKNDSLLQNINQLSDSTFNSEPEIITKNVMDSLRLYPLSPDETKAYQNIDSTKKIVSSLKLGGVGGKFIKNTDFERNHKKTNGKFTIGAVFKYINLQNNRVDGITAGLKHSGWISDKVASYSVQAGYALAREDINANFSLNVPIKNSFFNGIELSGNYATRPVNVFSHYPDFWNSAAVTLGFEDHFNYLHSTGGSLAVKKTLGKHTYAKLGFTIESQKSIDAIKYYSIFNSNRNVRINPQIINGMDNRIVLNFNSGKSPYKMNFMTADGFTSQVELSSKLFGSNFNYTRINVAYQFYIKTMYDELFFSPYLGIFIEASGIFGSYGLQHLYTPQTALGIFSPFGTFKGLAPYQFVGDKSIAIHLEHNWRKTFFDMLGIYFPVAWNLEFTTGINGLGIWNDSNFLINRNTDKYYWEVYAGISGILGIINVNAAYNSFKNTVVRFGFSKIF